MLLLGSMRSLVVLVALTVPAAADPHSTLQATPAKPGLLAGNAIASKVFASGVRVDVLDLAQPQFGEHDYRVALSDGHQWWGAADDVEALGDSCGMGKCRNTTLDRAAITQADGVAWIRFELTTQTHVSDPSTPDRTDHTTAVMACKLPVPGAAPSCALYRPLLFATATVTIHGTTVTARGEDATEVMDLVL